MQDQRAATLTAIFSDVLASLAFLFADDEGTGAPPEARWFKTTIVYRGPESGELHFWCTRDFSRLLASNLLGTEAGNGHADVIAEDAVKEFMNIVCGQFITTSHGTDAVFQLTIPRIEEVREAPAFDVDDQWTATLSVNQHRLRLSYTPAPSAPDA